MDERRTSVREGSALEPVLDPGRRGIAIDTGAWTGTSIDHTARTGADKGYRMILAGDACSTPNADRHRASIGFAMQDVAIATLADGDRAARERAAARG